MAEIKNMKTADDKAVKEIMNDTDKNELRREAARIMAEMSRTGAIENQKTETSTAKKQRPSTAKKAQPKDKEGNVPWVPPMVSTFKSTKKDSFEDVKPAVETPLQRQYDKFAKCNEVAVSKTI